jgi:Tfp pilus assembly protein PilN
MKLDLNLAREDGRPVRGWRPAAWVAAVVLVAGASVANGMHYRSVGRAMGPVEARLRGLEETVKRLETEHAAGLPAETRQALAALPGRVDAYNRILVAAAFPWTRLLMELEASLPPRVGLTTIQPDPVTGTVTLQGAGRSFADVVAFVHSLEQRAAFREVILLRHGEQNRGGTTPLIVNDFSIKLRYAAAGEEAPPSTASQS